VEGDGDPRPVVHLEEPPLVHGAERYRLRPAAPRSEVTGDQGVCRPPRRTGR
jgi:hypothetical protein